MTYPWFVNPRLIQTLMPSYPTTGKVQAYTETQDAANQPIKAWSDLPGHTNIPCRVETTGGNETKAANQVYATATNQIALAGYYPLITPKMRFVEVSGVVYDILLVNNDAFQAFTFLVVEVKH
jgi:head-tail adaptor